MEEILADIDAPLRKLRQSRPTYTTLVSRGEANDKQNSNNSADSSAVDCVSVEVNNICDAENIDNIQANNDSKVDTSMKVSMENADESNDQDSGLIKPIPIPLMPVQSPPTAFTPVAHTIPAFMGNMSTMMGQPPLLQHPNGLPLGSMPQLAMPMPFSSFYMPNASLPPMYSQIFRIAPFNMLAPPIVAKMRRRHRTFFSQEQLNILEKSFNQTDHLNPELRKRLAEECKITETSVEVWYKNRRAKRKKQDKMLKKDESIGWMPDSGDEMPSDDENQKKAARIASRNGTSRQNVNIIMNSNANNMTLNGNAPDVEDTNIPGTSGLQATTNKSEQSETKKSHTENMNGPETDNKKANRSRRTAKNRRVETSSESDSSDDDDKYGVIDNNDKSSDFEEHNQPRIRRKASSRNVQREKKPQPTWTLRSHRFAAAKPTVPTPTPEPCPSRSAIMTGRVLQTVTAQKPPSRYKEVAHNSQSRQEEPQSKSQSSQKKILLAKEQKIILSAPGNMEMSDSSTDGPPPLSPHITDVNIVADTFPCMVSAEPIQAPFPPFTSAELRELESARVRMARSFGCEIITDSDNNKIIINNFYDDNAEKYCNELCDCNAKKCDKVCYYKKNAEKIIEDGENIKTTL